MFVSRMVAAFARGKIAAAIFGDRFFQRKLGPARAFQKLANNKKGGERSRSEGDWVGRLQGESVWSFSISESVTRSSLSEENLRFIQSD